MCSKVDQTHCAAEFVLCTMCMPTRPTVCFTHDSGVKGVKSNSIAVPRYDRAMKHLWRELLNVLLIVLGILSATIGLHGFLFSSNFIDGGVTGISMLLAKVTGMPLSIWLPLINLPFIALGYRQIGRAFAVRSTLAIAGLSLSLATVPIPDITPDRLLTAVFGGFFLGAGVGFAVRGGAVLDGTEIAALLISKRSSLLKVGDSILIFNVVLFVTAMSVLGVEQALYSILTYIGAAKTLDFVIHGIEEYTAITIVSRLSGEIGARIMTQLGRGVTIYKGRGGLSFEDQEILYCVVTRLEIGKVKGIARALDERAFVTCHPLSDVEGGMVKRATLH
jgi:uncharacterized membrane-anchored protein YitT (DUF2179 family)